MIRGSIQKRQWRNKLAKRRLPSTHTIVVIQIGSLKGTSPSTWTSSIAPPFAFHPSQFFLGRDSINRRLVLLEMPLPDAIQGSLNNLSAVL